MVCGQTYSTRVPYTCPACGMSGLLDVQFDYASIRRRLTRRVLASREQSHWRYRELLPIGDDARPPALHVGWTPMCETKALARHLGTGSLRAADALGKDRSWRNRAGIAKHRLLSEGKLEPAVELVHRIDGIRAAVAEEDAVGLRRSWSVPAFGILSQHFIPAKLPMKEPSRPFLAVGRDRA